MFTTVSVETAVTVDVATPDALVTAVAGVKVTAPGTLTLNVTVTPLMTPRVSRTVADTVVLPAFAMVDEPRDTTTVLGTRGGVPIEIVLVPVTVPAVATIVAAASTAAALNVVVTTPEASVVPETGLKVPAVALITVNVTVTPETGADNASVTVAVTIVDPPEAMAEEARVT